MPIDYATLKSERTADPEGLGYASAEGDTAEAALLNEVRQGAGYVVREETLAHGPFLLAITPVLLRLASPEVSNATRAKWDRILGVINATESFHIADPRVQGLLASAVADGILLQAEVDAIGKRQGSRAEVLFGAGTVAAAADVEYARLRA